MAGEAECAIGWPQTAQKRVQPSMALAGGQDTRSL
jgi:hypothetical protein